MPDVAGYAGEKDRGVTAFKSAHHRHLGNGMPLPVILAKKERVDAGGIPAHDHVLVIVRKNLGLDEVTWAQEIGHRAGFANCAERALSETLAVAGVFALELFAVER